MRHSRQSARSGGADDPSPWAAGMIAFTGLAAIAAIVGGGWWVWQYSQSQQLTLPLKVGAAFDISGSMHTEEKQRAVGVLYTLVDAILPYQTPIQFWVYAEKLHESIKKTPARSSDLNDFARRSITERLGEWGTYQKLPLQAMLEFAQRHSNQTVILCLFTDGEDHTPKETRRLVETISRLPNVCAVLVGPLEEQFRANFRKQLEPLETSGKLIVFSMGDADRAVNELKAKLVKLNEEARRQ
jgi:predicted metal-dependent peptidase